MQTNIGKLWQKDPNLFKAVIGAAILDSFDSHHVNFSANAEEQAYIKKVLRTPKLKASIRKNQKKFIAAYDYWHEA